MPRIAVAAACLALTGLAAPAQAAAEAVPGELLVRFERGVNGAERADARADHDVALKRQTRVSGLQLVKTEPGQSVREAEHELEGDGRVAYAEPNAITHPASVPDDPFYSTLWGLEKIKAPGAWDATTGSSSVTVAVADTGVAYDHPDLVNRMWSNSGETPDNGLDDDGNGYVDDVRGWDAIDHDNDPRDLEDHGTHVAGTIGAEGDNATGITGVAQDSRIMPVRVLRPGGGTSDALVEGFDYAGDMGADIVNASLSGSGTVQAVQDVVEDHPNTLYVVAAGNATTGVNIDGAGATRFPCNVTAPNLICVAATDQNDNRAGFSNYGSTSVDLGAPGVQVRSTLTASSELSGSADGFEADDFATRWTATGTWARTNERAASGSWSMTDSPGANYANNTDSAVTTAAPYDLTGKQGCYLNYDMRLRTETNFDTLKVETSSDGSTWTTRATWSGTPAGNNFASYSTYLDSDGGQPYVRFHLVTDNAGQNDDGAHLDNVRVRCKSSTYDSSNYGYFSGTSMATPHVSGTAALVRSLRPTASVADLRAALLDGDPLPGLNGYTVTGKRLNALRAVGHDGPLAVTGAASAIGGTGATLQGSVNPIGSATDYHFEYGTSDSYGSETTEQSAGSGTTPAAVDDGISGLQPGTEYHFRLVATRGGHTVTGDDATFTTAASPTPPDQVQGLGVAPGVRSAALNWDDTPTATSYEVFKKVAGGSYPGTPSATASSSAYTATGLTEGVQVCFRVRAVNTDGPGPGSDEQCTTPRGPAPGAPGSLAATGGVRSVSLDWGDAQDATGYLVHRRTSTGTYPASPLAGSSTSAFSNSGLTGGTTYCYRVQGTNQWGTGPLSAERCALAQSPPPVTTKPSTPVQPAPKPADPILADLSRSKRSIRASRRGVFVWGFRATPSVLGRVTFTTKIGRRKLKLGSKRFRAGDGRSVRPRIKLSRRAMRLLRTRHRFRVRATVTLAGHTTSRTFTLKSP
jgi:subtilisin family serine protease